MPKLRLAPLGAALAAVLAGSTGYCVLQTGSPPAAPPAQIYAPPTPVTPALIEPFPPDDKG